MGKYIKGEGEKLYAIIILSYTCESKKAAWNFGNHIASDCSNRCEPTLLPLYRPTLPALGGPEIRWNGLASQTNYGIASGNDS